MNTDHAAPSLLYVEDDILIQDQLTEELERAGFKVISSSSGKDALAILQSDHAKIDGIVTDINLGNGPDGWEVARAAREFTHAVPVVYVSAASDHEWTSKGVPASVMVAKPFAPAQVVVAISALMTVSD